MILSKKEDIKRLGIFVFFNKEGKLEEYVEYLLSKISSHLDELFIISNCKLSYHTAIIFKKYTNNIYVRENSGLDAAAYKMALLYYCGIDKIREYDEVILFNDTVYGPFIEFSDIFNSMADRDIDFWGIMAGYKSGDALNLMPEGYIPDHIQSWFWAFRNTIIQSEEFKDYWIDYNDNLNSFWDVVARHEFVFTKHFEQLGYKWDIFCDSEEYRSDSLNKNFNFYGYATELMLKKMNMPFLKRKPFSLEREEILYMNGGEDFKNALEYLESYSEYPIDLIFKDLLHNGNVYDIYSSLNLNYILNPSNKYTKENSKIGIFIICHAIKSFQFLQPYIEKMCSEIDVNICILNGENESYNRWKDETKSMRVTLIKCDCDGIFALKDIKLVNQYEYIIFLHDAIECWGDFPITICKSILFNYAENLIKDLTHVNAMIESLEHHPKLGLMLAPMPIHNKYFEFYGDTWGDSLDEITKLAKAMNLKCNINPDKPIISASGSFCCRRQILDKLLAFPIDNEMYHMIGGMDTFSRLLQFMAQDAGYYSGIAMSLDYASLECMNQRFYLSSIMQQFKSVIKPETYSFNAYMNSIMQFSGNGYGAKKTDNNLYRLLKEKDEEIARLYPLTSLKVQIKLRLKKFLPKPVYKVVITLKRIIFGPRQILFDYTK